MDVPVREVSQQRTAKIYTSRSRNDTEPRRAAAVPFFFVRVMCPTPPLRGWGIGGASGSGLNYQGRKTGRKTGQERVRIVFIILSGFRSITRHD